MKKIFLLTIFFVILSINAKANEIDLMRGIEWGMDKEVAKIKFAGISKPSLDSNNRLNFIVEGLFSSKTGAAQLFFDIKNKLNRIKYVYSYGDNISSEIGKSKAYEFLNRKFVFAAVHKFDKNPIETFIFLNNGRMIFFENNGNEISIELLSGSIDLNQVFKKSSASPIVRGKHWDMTFAEVTEDEKKNYDNYDFPIRYTAFRAFSMIRFKTSIFDKECHLTYDFHNDTLSRVDFYFLNLSFQEVKELFYKLKNILAEKYDGFKIDPLESLNKNRGFIDNIPNLFSPKSDKEVSEKDIKDLLSIEYNSSDSHIKLYVGTMTNGKSNLNLEYQDLNIYMQVKEMLEDADEREKKNKEKEVKQF